MAINPSEKLFSYGTLQQNNVQLKKFGRLIKSQADTLLAYELRNCIINDIEVIETSGTKIHPIACYTANNQDSVSGVVFDITPEELAQADQYEVDNYKRVKCQLASGTVAWVYVQNGLNIDVNKLKEQHVRLTLFSDNHIPALLNKAQDKRIWKFHRERFDNPEVFKSIRIAKAKRDIAKKTRCMFVIYYKNEIIGASSYYDIDLKHLTMKIGYTWFHPDYWGKGINQTVKKLMLKCAFEDLKFKRIAFSIDSENIPSRNAIEKLGIPLEGILKNHMIRRDLTSRDSAIYAITSNEWQRLYNA